jgi:hypothetical protein
MSRRTKLSRMPLVAFLSCALLGPIVPVALPQALTADQIVEKNIAARGGVKAWREIQTMILNGKMDAGSQKNVELPFVLKLKRPQMSRLELDFAGKKALQIYDGKNGWKVRPFLGRNEVEPFTTAEIHTAADQGELDGYLIDHEAKGIKVEVMGADSVEGHDAYRLQLTMKDGQVRHLWVDAKSFLEVKVEGTPRRFDGTMRNVEIYYRNYGSVSGLMIPFVLETVVEKVQPSRKITIETVVLNPRLEDNAFAKPDLPGMNLIAPVQQSAAQVPPVNAAAKEAPGEKLR